MEVTDKQRHQEEHMRLYRDYNSESIIGKSDLHLIFQPSYREDYKFFKPEEKMWMRLCRLSVGDNKPRQKINWHGDELIPPSPIPHPEIEGHKSIVNLWLSYYKGEAKYRYLMRSEGGIEDLNFRSSDGNSNNQLRFVSPFYREGYYPKNSIVLRVAWGCWTMTELTLLAEAFLQMLNTSFDFYPHTILPYIIGHLPIDQRK